MNRKKAMRKDLKGRFTGTLKQLVKAEDPEPSKKVKKIIKQAAGKLARAVAKDAEKMLKKAQKAEKKPAGKSESAEKEKKKKPVEIEA